jgi:DNA-directed RNA polymerase specialized sigma24 family protein
VTQPKRDDPERIIVAWRTSATPLEVFEELRDPMRQAARRGLRFVLSHAPDENDVDDVVTRAFSEVLEDASDEVKRDTVAFAKVVARRRGVDRGRSIIRKRQEADKLLLEVERHRVTDEDLAGASAKEKRLRAAEQAMDDLTAEQRDVIERTVMGQESLSDWTHERGTTYEAGRRLRARGLEALRKQIEGGGGHPAGRNEDG